MSDLPPDISAWRHHWQDEVDAAFLYQALADAEPNAERQLIYRGLAKVEERHTEMWQKIFTEHGINDPQPRTSSRARLLAWVGRRFGPRLLLPMLLREEAMEVKNYLGLHQRSTSDLTRDTARTLARESASHTDALGRLANNEDEPWHSTESGDLLRGLVYGFNDGLTANFGLVAGLIGAAVDYHIVLVTGLAGMVADALSMGSSGYLARKSEQEVYAHEIALEKQEIELMPEVEEEELRLIYQLRGIDEERSRQLAHEVISDPEQALNEMVREELKIGAQRITPLREGWITGSATAVGAFIPVAPFLIFEGTMAIWLSFGLSMLSHFAVGAARSIFTGLGLVRSGLDMFAVGMGVAAVGYVVGDLVIRLL